MVGNEYVNAYKKTQQSIAGVTSPHEIIRSLMKELINSMQKIVLDIQDDRNNKQKIYSDSLNTKKHAMKKSKSFSKSLSIIYGLQTCLDFDKAPEIATNLFQLYEFCRHQIIRGFSKKNDNEIVKALEVIRQVMDGWEVIRSHERHL
jgi:flagellar secretion chaperone FliS